MHTTKEHEELEAKEQHDVAVLRITSQTTTTPSAAPTDQTLWQSIKTYRKVVSITLGLTSAILLFGYDNVVVGTVSGMPSFQYFHPTTRSSPPPHPVLAINPCS